MSEQASVDRIAIVGMAGRFPGARDLDEFWTNLREGRESISFFSEEELRASGVKESRFTSPGYVPAKGYLEGVELFDAEFFGFSPRQAEITDPQQRLLSEVAVEALENAGCDPARFRGAIGVFGGASLSTYLLTNLHPNEELMSLVGPTDVFTRNRGDHLCTRIAYALNLRGPAVTVQTACSTSLVAVHVACNALLQGECDVALAGGVSVTVPRKAGYLYQEGGILSPDGHCRAFDSQARGTLSGEGAGMIVLKRLADAEAAGDTIHAVIRGSAINNDGSLKVGYTAPSARGQAAVIAEALAVAGVRPETVSYVEAHGTGTPLGDPIEVSALSEAFGSATGSKAFCGIGSVKTNIGHLDAAAGVAGLIKTVLALRHRELPPSLHFAQPNPAIDFASSPFYVNTRLREWRRIEGAPLCAGVSAFGFGGTNCHVVLEEAPEATTSGPSRELQLVLLSAKSAPSLDAATARLGAVLRAKPQTALPDAAYTLAFGRTEYRHRRAVLCRTATECAEALGSLDPRRVVGGEAREAHADGVVFLFPGEGSEYTRMGRDLYERERVFRDAMDRCLGVIAVELHTDPREIMWAERYSRELKDARWARPCLLAVEWSLAQLWIDWGVKPVAMIGHGVGEYAAACVAGALDVADALRLVVEQGNAMATLPTGSAMTVPLPRSELDSWLAQLDPGGERLALAAVNGQSSCVVAGVPQAVEQLETRLEEAGVEGCRRSAVAPALHSPLLNPVLGRLRDAARRAKPRVPATTWISSVTADLLSPEEAANPDYWVRQLRSPVLFFAALSRILRESPQPLLEVGPGESLRGLARWHPDKRAGQLALSSLPAVARENDADRHLRTTLARLWVAGVQVDQERYFRDERRRRVPLPAYSFDRRRYWIRPPESVHAASERARQGRQAWFHTPVWRRAALPEASNTERATTGTWLVIGDDLGFAKRLVERIEARGGRVTLCMAPKTNGAGATDGNVAQGTDDYERLLGELPSAGGEPLRIVHLASLKAGDSGAADRNRALPRGFQSLLHLAQALGRRRSEPIDFCVVSNGVYDVTGNESLYPEHATVLGLCRVLPHENPNVICRNVDLALPLANAEQDWERLADHVLAEALTPKAERAAAYRGAQRWAEDYGEVDLAASDASLASLLRPGGVYLIVGAGGIGLEIAHFLSTRHRAKIAFVSRSELPPRDQWTHIVAQHGDTDRMARRISRVQSLEDRADLLWIKADIANEPEMVEAVRQVRERFGRIDGVVHAAGVPATGIIELKTDEAAAKVLAAKVHGTNVLCSIFAAAPPDFFVFCSARGSVLGGIGQVDYAAGNAYLDALAHALSRGGNVRAVSVDWPGWREVGMLADAALAHDGARPPAGERPQAIDHPLLARKVRSEQGMSEFVAQVGSATHWVLDEHRIVGTPVMPGTAYLEVARAAIEEFAGPGVLELQNVFFLRPLVVRDGQLGELKTTVERTPEGALVKFSGAVASKKREAPVWQDLCVAEARVSRGEQAPVHDLRAWLERCSRERVVVTHESLLPDDLGPRWRSIRAIHVGDGELVARLELPDAFVADLPTYGVHPAVVDRINLAARDYLSHEAAGRSFYLPFGYRRVTVRSALPQRFWAHCQRNFDRDGGGETISFDVILVDDDGLELVRVADFSEKRVNQITERLRLFTGADLAAAQAEADAEGEGPESIYERALHEAISPREGIAALGPILCARGLAQVIVSPHDFRDLIASRAPRRGEPKSAADQGAEPRHPAPEQATPHRPGQPQLERLMTEIWEEVLGVKPVTPDGNFFELGGDSVQAIQILMRYKKSGFEITQGQFFQHQTIAKQAAVVREAGSRATVATLSLEQRKLLERVGEPAVAMVVRLNAAGIAELTTLAKAFEGVANHHVVLRKPSIGPEAVTGAIALRHVEVSTDRTAEERTSALAVQLAADLDADDPPMISAALVTVRDREPELLIAIRESVADLISVRAIFDDLLLAYQQVSAGTAVQLAQHGASLTDWLAALESQGPAAESRGFAPSEHGPAPARLRASAGFDGMVPGGAASTSLVLGLEDSGLVRAAARKRKVSVEELLLAALEIGLAKHVDGSTLTLHVRRSARADDVAGLDLSRTVGPLLGPLSLRFEVKRDARQRRDDVWRKIKEQLRPTLTRPVHFTRATPPTARIERDTVDAPTLRYAYAGDLDVSAAAGALLDVRWVALHEGSVTPPLLRVFQAGGCFHVCWGYDGGRFHRQAVETWARDLVQELRALAVAADDAVDVEYVASDFPLANLDKRSLEQVAALLRDQDSAEGG